MKQYPRETNCIAVCAAMATNSTLRDVERVVGKKAIYSDLDIYRFILHQGYYPGIVVNVKHEQVKINSSFKILVSPQDGPALVYVESERTKNDLHAIYWNGTQVYDPNPYTKHGRPLSSYKIVEWVPIRKVLRSGAVYSSHYRSINPHKKKKKKTRKQHIKEI